MIDLDILRTRIGLTAGDNTRDAALAASWRIALAWTENYLDRKLILGADTETFIENRQTISLRRYPVVSITSVSHGQASTVQPSGYTIDKDRGVLYLGKTLPGEITVGYMGGYDENALPDDLLYAILNAFDNAFGIAPGGDKKAIAAAGGIKAVSVPDVGRIEYDTGASGSDEIGGGYGTIFGAFIDILSPYKREKC